MEKNSNLSGNSELSLVSVLIRSTGRRELGQALASVAAQTYLAIEVVIVDATGTDVVLVPRDFPLPLRVLSGQRLQRSLAANALLDAAQGRWALFLDDDDWLAPEHVERLVAVMETDSQLVGTYAGVSCIEFDAADVGGFTEVRRFDDFHDPVRLMFENYIPINAMLFELALTRDLDGPRFDAAFDLFEDWDFWLQLLAHGPFRHVAGVSAFYRIHGDSGVGVRLEEGALAEAALDQLIAKWRSRWSAEHLHSMVGFSRKGYQYQGLNDAFKALQKETSQAIDFIRQDLEEQLACERKLAQTTLESTRQALEDQLAGEREMAQAQLSTTRQALEDQLAGEREIARVNLQAAYRKSEDQLSSYENSRSWRLTRPLRDFRRSAQRWSELKPLAAFQVTVSRGLLSLATRAYRSEALASVVRMVPTAFKRRVRNALLQKTFVLGAQAQAGLQTHLKLEAVPKVSIIIPVYNHIRYIEKCIRSALAQDWVNLEVIVVNDASSDPGVRNLLDQLEGLPRLTIEHNASNTGICLAQNRALTLSSGDVIAFLDCDDYLMPDAITTCMRYWRDDVVYLHSGRINVDENDCEINRINFASLPRQDYFAENLNAMYATHLKLIRRDAFVRVGLFDPRFDSAQDYEMLMRVAFHYPSSSFVHVPEFLYCHRLHSEQTTETRRAEQDRMTGLIQDEARLRESIRLGQYSRFVSFIMLSYGKHSQTLKAIEGLRATVCIPHEIILYDNGSDADTVAFLRSEIDGKFDHVQVHYGDRNLGPALGRRMALDQARGEWVIIFDNDEIPEPGWLEELLLRADSAENVGAVCCRVAFPDKTLQFSGGKVELTDDGGIDLALYDRGLRYDDLSACIFREVDWCPIGATLFTQNIARFLHDGYPNTFEDAGVSFALKKLGLKLLNAPGALVWHDHITFQPKAEMREQYMRDRYNPKMMLKSVASFYKENGLLIHDEYIWRENGLKSLSREQILVRLDEALTYETRF